MSDPTEFPLLKLPWLSAEKILQYIFLNDNEDTQFRRFANLSKRCYNLTQKTRLLTGFNMRVFNETVVLNFLIKNNMKNNTKKLTLYTGFAAEQRTYYWDKRSNSLCQRPMRGNFPTAETLGAELQTVLEFYNNKPVKSVFLWPQPPRSHEIPYYFPIENCEKLFIRTKIPNDDFATILNRCKPTKWLEIDSLIKGFDFAFSTLSTERIEIRNSLELTNKTNIQNLKCKYARFGGALAGAEDLESIVDVWMKSDNKILQYMEIELIGTEPRLDLRKYNPIKFDPRRRSEVFVINAFPEFGVHLEEGLDFERNDGLLLTVLLENHKFSFVVWDDRFPDLSHFDEKRNFWMEMPKDA